MDLKNSKVNVEINLNWEDFPDESEMLQNLIDKGNLSSFLYVILQDIKTGSYNLEESHKQQILDEIITTVTTIYEAMSGLDTNVTSLIKTVNTITENPKVLSTGTITQERNGEISSEVIKLEDFETIEVEKLDLDIDTGENDDLDFTGMEDMFLP